MSLSEAKEEDESYPVAVFCIIATEFCERFSFCGLRTILSLYLRDALKVSEDTVVVIYHGFITFCYLVPVLGAVLADGCIGRYRTILYFSIGYLCGNLLTCASSIPPLHLPVSWLTALGLVMIAVGTGGIKPCVAAFGADQFRLPGQQKWLQKFFSVFYFAINLGGLAGMLAAPLLRSEVKCFGETTCYAVGFGTPAALMLLALLLFILGRSRYRLLPAQNTVTLEFFTCTARLVARRIRRLCSKSPADHHEDDIPADVRDMHALLALYAPLPLFWSLFDQQGSRWTFQAGRTDTTLLGKRLPPDHVQALNPILVLALIPIVERGLYRHVSWLSCPLRRMAVGGLLAAAAFIAAGLLQLRLEWVSPEEVPDQGKGALRFFSTLPCTATVDASLGRTTVVQPEGEVLLGDIPVNKSTLYSCVIRTPSRCGKHRLHNLVYRIDSALNEKHLDNIFIGFNYNRDLVAHMENNNEITKSINNKPRIRVVYFLDTIKNRNVTVTLGSEKGERGTINFEVGRSRKLLESSTYLELEPGRYSYEVKSPVSTPTKRSLTLQLGGIYVIVIREFKNTIEYVGIHIEKTPNTVHMAWMLPQFILISVGEIMFAISGLEFSFMQSPKSMKTVTIAAWYVSVALGNLLVVLIAKAGFLSSQAGEFFLFAVLLVLDMVWFWRLATKFKPKTTEEMTADVVAQESAPLLEKDVRLRDISSRPYLDRR